MNQQSTVRDIEKRAQERRISVPELCRRAGIAVSTFYRWKKTANNPDPKGANMHLIEQLYQALERVDAEDMKRLSSGNSSAKAVAA